MEEAAANKPDFKILKEEKVGLLPLTALISVRKV